jgi:WD40 repeat protein
MIWKRGVGIFMRTLKGNPEGVHTVSFSPDGQILATSISHNDQAIRLWKMHTGDLVRKLKTQLMNGVEVIIFSLDG